MVEGSHQRGRFLPLPLNPGKKEEKACSPIVKRTLVRKGEKESLKRGLNHVKRGSLLLCPEKGGASGGDG